MAKQETAPLDPSIIEEIKKEEERRRKKREGEDRPEIDDTPPPDKNTPKPVDDGQKRGIVIIGPDEPNENDSGYGW